jgi:hypothetical protein
MTDQELHDQILVILEQLNGDGLVLLETVSQQIMNLILEQKGS